jgi:hypothetical protein
MGNLVQKLTIKFDSGPPKEKLPNMNLVVLVNLVLITILNCIAFWFMVQ